MIKSPVLSPKFQVHSTKESSGSVEVLTKLINSYVRTFVGLLVNEATGF